MVIRKLEFYNQLVGTLEGRRWAVSMGGILHFQQQQ